MNEKITCESKIDVKASILLKLLLLIPLTLIIIAVGTGEPFDFSWAPGWLMIFGIIFTIVVSIVIFALSSCKMVVTDKRVYGKATFGQRVDLPLDMISAASTGLFKSVGVSTASGRITFWILGNQNELYSAITTLLLERQQSKIHNSHETITSYADELKKYKELLDDGVITQDEFDAKKNRLLDL